MSQSAAKKSPAGPVGINAGFDSGRIEPPLLRCETCRGLIDDDDLFCATCGREAPAGDRQVVKRRLSTHNFECRGCGASMSYDASAQSLRCPFCGGVDLDGKPDAPAVAAEIVVPFEVDRDAAVGVMREALSRGFWRPGDLAKTAAVEEMRAVLVPFWSFAAGVHAYWTGDTDQKQLWQHAAWRPLAGEYSGQCSELFVCASGALAPAETARIGPFDLTRGAPPDAGELNDVIEEEFSLSRKLARPLAIDGIEEQTRSACAALIPGKSRNVHVNVLLGSLSSRPVLLPVWIMGYRYQDQVYRFLVNGQTGKGHGTVPQSLAKKIGCAAAVVAAIAAAIGGALLFAS